MTDPTPPPDERLPDQSRARIRAELLEAAQAGPPPRRWLVPGAVAAAVLLVAGIAAWAVQAGGDTSDHTPDDGVPPVAATSTTAAPSPVGTPTATPTPGNGHQVGTGSCADELADVLPGAQEAASFGTGAEQWDTSFWVRDDRFVLCDRRAGVTTVHHPLPLEPVDRASTYAVSSVSPDWPHSDAVIRVAGGIVPAGATAFDVAYTFPNGGTQHADVTTDHQGRTWWRMLYVYDAGRGNELDQPPIEVTVSYSGAQEHYTLRWGLDTCAQANHGC